MARYTPGIVPNDPKALPDFLVREFAKIAQALDTADQFLTLDTLYAAPAKYRDGMVCKADGTTWNPGSGAGVYVYRGGAWHFLG
jgi:hypothetical protein